MSRLRFVNNAKDDDDVEKNTAGTLQKNIYESTAKAAAAAEAEAEAEAAWCEVAACNWIN